MERLKCVSLFSGIGGFDLAMTNLGHEIVGACEIDGPARTIYARHFPKVKLWQDATKLDPKDLPGHDILMGGFPCQAFSVAGKRLGFQECRGTLFYEIIRVVKETRPSIVFLENVMGLLNHNNARTIIQIISSLDEVGYDVEWQVTNSKYHVPQNRERIFIVGHLRGSGSRKIFPITDINGQDNVKQQETQTAKEPNLNVIGGLGSLTSQKGKVYGPDGISPTLSSGTHGYVNGYIQTEPKLKTVKEDDRDSYRVYDPSGIARTLRASQGGLGKMTGVYAVAEPNFMNKQRNGKRIKDHNEPSFCLDSNPAFIQGVIVNKRLRKLTPTECERLQGFPDGWTEAQSDTQRYKQLGNAVTVPMVQVIAERFKI
jgi:DNA (cytosine-5)-methyltransferase 1